MTKKNTIYKWKPSYYRWSYFPPQLHMVKSSLPMWSYLEMVVFGSQLGSVMRGELSWWNYCPAQKRYECFSISVSLCLFLSVISAMRGHNSYPAIWKPGRQLSSEPHHRGAVLRWWRNRMGRSLSAQQIDQKIIWTLNRFHKTTSERWRRTSSTQISSPFSSKGDRTKYKR